MALFAVIATVILVSLWVVAFLPILRKEETGDELYRFGLGTTWTYLQNLGEKTNHCQEKVVKVEDGKVWHETRILQEGKQEPLPDSDFFDSIDNGYLVRTWNNESSDRSKWRLYKLNSRKGQTWQLFPDGAKEQVTIRHLGITSVVVPAGTFPNAIGLRMELKESVTDYYLVPGVGVVNRVHRPRLPPNSEVEIIPLITWSLLQFSKNP